MLTFVIFVIEKLISGHHVHQADNAALLLILGSIGASKHGDGTYTAIDGNLLRDTHGGTGHLEEAVAEWDRIQALDDLVHDVGISVFAKSNTLVV